MKPLLVLLLTLAPLHMAAGQSVDTTLGGSQILGLAGVQTSYQFKGRFGWAGLGYHNGLQLGGYMNMPLSMFTLEANSRDKYRLGLVDQDTDSSLAVDEYEHRSTVRGTSLLRHTLTSDLQVFFGNFSVTDTEPFLYSAYQFSPNLVGSISGHVNVSKKLTLKSLNTFSGTVTSIQSMSWMPSSNWRLSTAAGVGINHPYFANAAEFEKGHLYLRASFTVADNKFHRQDSSYDVEPLGLNAKATLPVGQNTTFRLNHTHELISVPKYLLSIHNTSISTMDNAGASTSFWGFRTSVSAGKSNSNLYLGKNYTGSASMSRSVMPRWRTTFSYLRNVSLQDIEVYQDTNEVRVNNHLSISHNIDRINGVLSNTLGGRWSSNVISLSIDNQVYTSPVAAQFGQKSVFQAWNFSIRFRTPHGTTTHLETIIDPFGKTQWGGYMSGLQYRGLNTYSQEVQHVSFSKYVIQGKVVDEHDNGVWGIALHVGSELVMSGQDGTFFTHVKNPKPVAFAVAADASLQGQRWTLASAPTSVHGTLEATAEPVRVVVQMANHNRAIAQAGGN